MTAALSPSAILREKLSECPAAAAGWKTSLRKDCRCRTRRTESKRSSPPVWYRSDAHRTGTSAARRGRNTRRHRSGIWRTPVPTPAYSRAIAARESSARPPAVGSPRRWPDVRVPSDAWLQADNTRAATRLPTISPMTPERKNTHRQFSVASVTAISGGASRLPPPCPALMMPIAVERSWAGNHSATALVAAGKPPPSPIPRRNRLTASNPKVAASPWLAHASDHQTMITRKPLPGAQNIDQFAAARVHQRVGQRKAACSCENCVLEIGISCWIALIATGSVCRSK